MPKKTWNSDILNPSTSKVNDPIGFAARRQTDIAAALQKAIFTSAFFSSIATDEKGVIQLFNAGAERMLGYAAADVVNKMTPADLSDAQELIARAQALSIDLSTPIKPGFETLVFKASRGVEDIYELTYIRKDGSRLPAVVSITALRDAQDAILGYLLIGTDNTARKQAEKEKEKEKEDLFRFPSENPNPIIRIAKDGTLLYINPQGRKQLNEWHLSEGKAAPLNLCKVVLESFDAEKVLQMDLNYGKRVFSFFVAPFAASGYANLYAIDITERKKAEQKFRQLNKDLEKRVKDRTAQLEAANEELDAFAYSVSHDLRAPLRAMDGFSNALKTGYPEKLDVQGKHYLERIQAASLEMGHLIDDLLNLSRVTRSELKQQEIDLSGMARTIAAELKTQFPERNVVFKISDKMKLTGDANLFKIALENLINNAWKFTSTRAQAMIEVGMEEQKGRQVYFVRDNGVGFDIAYINKLFIPFQRLHAKQEFPGTGIGLVTVKRIITRHGGRIWAEAGLDQGAAFYFTVGGEA
jgi:PAS domain S-box-containing protein